MIIHKIAFRNIFRNKWRSILTGMMMAGGCALFGLFRRKEDNRRNCHGH
ncbi:MAG: hypothetical protein HY807_07975 [Nitrospirae bacterium]|nr:hypothetical protein [Nitrospirota bacterium]